MKTGTKRLCKGGGFVKCETVSLISKIEISRIGHETENSGIVQISKVVPTKGFSLKSTSKRDNGNIAYTVS